MEYGLIGKNLTHSFSDVLHGMLMPQFPYTYQTFATDQQVSHFFKERNFQGVNVTIPYKKTAMQACDVLEQTAKEIGAVNTVVNRNGKLMGYQTDYFGFLAMAKQANLSFYKKHILILGTGATAKLAAYAAQKQGAKQIDFVSRTPKAAEISVHQAQQNAKQYEIIIQATPVGMYPHTEECPLCLDAFSKLEGVLDVIYNPLRTKLIQQAQSRKIPHAGGLIMLVAQAFFAQQYFHNCSLPPEMMQICMKNLSNEKSNLVLIGMPSSGKSTLGKRCALEMQKEFVDTDVLIERQIGKKIADFLQQETQQAFRDLEEKVIQDVAKKSGQVIATGGGCIARQKNIDRLKQNGVVIWVNRPLEMLMPSKDRPLSQTQDQLVHLWETRKEKYQAHADKMIRNETTIEQAVTSVQEAYHDILYHQWAEFEFTGLA